ncbi:MAG TPA: GntG family PLP-dependent aldolase [Candidatus Thermoplasmatota archaeon]|jgi:threonine aldolase|nr:GntG family PLP-dependent aldolase [Candidatus Thermoplasmatota archaeon]
MAKAVDLRSDTVTQPTPAMREAMARAEVGDDVYGEDPTVNRLQELAARMVGKEAALFVPSGHMGNVIALMVHTRRQGEVILERESHMYLSEGGAGAALAGVQSWPLEGKEGVLAPEQVRAALRGDDPHHPRTGLVCLENSHNRHGGAVLTRDHVRAVKEVLDPHHIPLHLDGARLFNAAAALGKPAADVARDADSVMFCLSKGLCAPVGSMIAGSREFVAEAVRARKLLGGGMRQAGVLAAAGIVALEQMVARLGEDHAKAAVLARAVEQAGLRIAHPQRTNIVMFEAPSPADLVKAMAKEDVRIDMWHDGKLRMVTHHDVTAADVDRAAQALRKVAGR